MKLYKTKSGIVVSAGEQFFLFPEAWDTWMVRTDLHAYVSARIASAKATNEGPRLIREELLPPIGNQEVWAAGVTYYRSREARMEESKSSGASTFYDKVYDAERPELFFKSSPYRVAGHGETLHIRRDSSWNVPEPELTLFMDPTGKIQGYTIGNDMSSRSIEGENPLYLPQAKTYDRSAGLGPCLWVPGQTISPDTTIALTIAREGKAVYQDSVAISKMKRGHDELAGFLFREMSFPFGCYLMTGTCLVPGNDFTLQPDDEVTIAIDGIGTLHNAVAYRGQ